MRVTVKVGDRHYPLDGSALEDLDEQSSYRICLEEERTNADPEQYVARAGEAGLTLVRSRVVGNQVSLEWEWTPDFFAGEFALEIRYQGTRIWPDGSVGGSLFVRTPAYKLTADDYQAMLADLCRWTTGWLAPAPGRRAGAAVDRRTNSRIGALEYLIQHWPQIEQLVEAVLERPRRALEREEVLEPLYAARTVTAEQWARTIGLAALWTEQDGRLPQPLERLGQRSHGLLPERLVQTRARSTLDIPENRLVHALLLDIRYELSAVLDELGSYGHGESLQRRQLVAGRIEQTRAILKRVNGWLRGTWLSELEPISTSVPPTVAMLKHPAYGGIWRHYLQWKRAVVLQDGGGRPVPIERTYQLYEFWCFLVVARQVASLVGVDPDRAIEPVLEQSDESVRLRLRPNVPFELQLPGVRLSFQRTFSYRGRDLRSVSFDMRPDISMEYQDEDGRTRVLLFDPKYRVGHSSLCDGLGAMHRYRDAIVDQEGNRAVVGAYLLCPAAPALDSDRRYVKEEYQSQGGWGFASSARERGRRSWVIC